MNSKNTSDTNQAQALNKTDVSGSACKHLNAKYVEIVQGFQQKIFDENGYYANLETGNRIGVCVECYDCGKKINITPKAKLPKWVKSMINTLEENNFSNSGSRL